MGRTSASTLRAAKIPKHLIEIGMSPEQYFNLKVHIKSIVLPGTPAFEGRRFHDKFMYRKWLDYSLVEIGPRFFPKGGNGLVWPADYHRIYGAVDQVIQVLGYKIRKDHKKKTEGLRVDSGEKNNEMGVVEGDEHCRSGIADDTKVDQDILVVNEEFAREKMQEGEMQKGEMQEGEMIGMDQNGADGKAMEAEMEAGPIELDDLSDLMRPEAFAEFPDFADESFDWVGITDFSRPEPVRSLANWGQFGLSI